MTSGSADDLQVSARGPSLRLSVRVKPRAARSRLVGVEAGALVVAVAAPPVEGAANRELVATLARALGLRRSSIAIAAGAGGRHKLVDVDGVEPAELRARIARALG